MEEKDIKQQFHLLQKEVETAGTRLEDIRLNLVAAIDALKLEIEILKRFMERYHADFARRYPELREELMREVDPEWLAVETLMARGLTEAEAVDVVVKGMLR